jgi:thioester reductase-like protein
LYASSLLAVAKADAEGNLSEEYPDESESGIAIKSGYSLSKFIGEKLALEASKRGIPVTVLRYASIFGNSKTGYMPPGYNHAWSILLSCIRVRKFPSFDQNGVPIMPVDTAADISTRLFLSDSAETGVYNLTNNSIAAEEDIKEAFSIYGIDGEFVPFSEWRDVVFEDSADMNALGPLSFLYEDEGSAPRYLSFHPLANEFPSLQINRLSSKLQTNLPGVEKTIVPAKLLLERHLDSHFKSLTKGHK